MRGIFILSGSDTKLKTAATATAISTPLWSWNPKGRLKKYLNFLILVWPPISNIGKSSKLKSHFKGLVRSFFPLSKKVCNLKLCYVHFKLFWAIILVFWGENQNLQILFAKMLFRTYFPSKIFCSWIFLTKIFLVKIFDKYFCCQNIFGPPLLIAHPLLPYIKPPPIVTPSSGIFEVKCDRRRTNLRTGRSTQWLFLLLY